MDVDLQVAGHGGPDLVEYLDDCLGLFLILNERCLMLSPRKSIHLHLLAERFSYRGVAGFREAGRGSFVK